MPENFCYLAVSKIGRGLGVIPPNDIGDYSIFMEVLLLSTF
jgi:hypothetical protein